MTDFHARRIDVSRPSAARIYDYMLGGDYNYDVDRDFAARIIAAFPAVRDLARQNRRFLGEAVQYVASEGIRQFIDIGSGIPTARNVHQVAQEIDPKIRVVYVDNSEDAVAESRAMLEGNETATVIEADLRDPSTILEHADTARLIDFKQPIGLLIVSVLHFVLDRDRPYELVRDYVNRLASGSYLVLSHASADEASPENRERFEAVERDYGDTSNPGTLRTRQEFERFFDGLDAVRHGVTYAANWKSGEPVDPDDPARCFYAAVGQRP